VSNRRHYVVITQQIEGNERVGFDAYFYSDLKFYDRRNDAIGHGLRVFGHDDFNIGTVQGGHLVAFGWGDWDFGPEHGDEEPHGGFDLAEIERQTCILGHRWPS